MNPFFEACAILDKKSLISAAKKYHDNEQNKISVRSQIYNPFELNSSIAIIPVRGPLVKYSSWYISYEEISGMIDKALSEGVKKIIMAFDTPGGLVNGCDDLSKKIYDLRDKIEIIGHVSGYAASAGYYLASACSKLYKTHSSAVGSIGTILSVIDDTKFWEDFGIMEYTFLSKASPKKNPDPASKEGSAQIQSWVDQWGDQFVSAVARNRNTSTENVLKNFGQGDIIIGPEAVTLGMVDGIMTLDELINQITNEGGSMAGNNTPDAKHTDADLEAAQKKAADEALAAERKRGTEIRANTIPGNEKLAQEAIDKGTSLSDFLIQQTAAVKVHREEELKKVESDAGKIPRINAMESEMSEEDKLSAMIAGRTK